MGLKQLAQAVGVVQHFVHGVEKWQIAQLVPSMIVYRKLYTMYSFLYKHVVHNPVQKTVQLYKS